MPNMLYRDLGSIAQLYNTVHKIPNGSFQKNPLPPPQRILEVNPTPFGCPNTLTILRNNFFSPPLQDGRKFLHVGVV
jgi:hypothetical protein